MPELRRMAIDLKLYDCILPFIIKCNYSNLSEEKFQLYSSTDIGGLLLDGFGDGVWIKQKECVSTQVCNSTAFGILQATLFCNVYQYLQLIIPPINQLPYQKIMLLS